ncbi:unnamed protein product [Rotaria sp. Silwood1]|nr:unnamed protein product [Rotaria sp. Silwood1]
MLKFQQWMVVNRQIFYYENLTNPCSIIIDRRADVRFLFSIDWSKNSRIERCNMDDQQHLGITNDSIQMLLGLTFHLICEEIHFIDHHLISLKLISLLNIIKMKYESYENFTLSLLTINMKFVELISIILMKRAFFCDDEILIDMEADTMQLDTVLCNLFIVDICHSHIDVISLNGQYCTIIYSNHENETGITRSIALDLDTVNGYNSRNTKVFDIGITFPCDFDFLTHLLSRILLSSRTINENNDITSTYYSLLFVDKDLESVYKK